MLADARNRGVTVYLYNIYSKDLDLETYLFFKDLGIAYDQAYTHAKILAVDDTIVAIGSCNWLSKDNSWENASLCLSGEDCSDLVSLLWRDLKYYRNLQFQNYKQIRQYQNNPYNNLAVHYDIDRSTKLTYIHSLDAHLEFIANVFEAARQHIIFCAPFVNPQSGYQEDFEKQLLQHTITKKVHIYFVGRTEDTNFSSFEKYLGELHKSPFVHLILSSDIHLKTVIMDDTIIAEGSFNWLSASRDKASDHHNHEVTLALKGNSAKSLIQDFYQSPIGQVIYEISSSQSRSHSNLANKFSIQFRINISPNQNLSYKEAQQRARWLNLDWKISKMGNTYINPSKDRLNRQIHNIVIIENAKGFYSVRIDGNLINQWYDSEDQTKLAAFDFI